MSDSFKRNRRVPWLVIAGLSLLAGLIAAYLYVFAPQETGGGYWPEAGRYLEERKQPGSARP